MAIKSKMIIMQKSVIRQSIQNTKVVFVIIGLVYFIEGRSVRLAAVKAKVVEYSSSEL